MDSYCVSVNILLTFKIVLLATVIITYLMNFGDRFSRKNGKKAIAF
ncbi:MAG: hypothetical protein ACOC0N_00785 [Chroococcales cyanobacterium]